MNKLKPIELYREAEKKKQLRIFSDHVAFNFLFSASEDFSHNVFMTLLCPHNGYETASSVPFHLIPYVSSYARIEPRANPHRNSRTCKTWSKIMFSKRCAFSSTTIFTLKHTQNCYLSYFRWFIASAFGVFKFFMLLRFSIIHFNLSE